MELITYEHSPVGIIIQALQGHKLLATINLTSRATMSTADAWPEGGLSSLQALHTFQLDSVPPVWLGPLLEDLAGCAALEVARLASFLPPVRTGSPQLPAGALQAMASRVAAGGMARLSSLRLATCTGTPERCMVADVLPLVEALAKRGAGSSMPGAASDVLLALPLNMAATGCAELQQLLQARGLLLQGSSAGEQGLRSFSARARLSRGPTVTVHHAECG